MADHESGGRHPGLSRRQAGSRQQGLPDPAMPILVLGGDLAAEILALLRTLGLTGQGAASAAEVRQQLAAGPWQLLVCAAPVADWAPLVGELRGRGEQLPVLAILEAADPVTVLAAVRAGIQAYAVAPLSAGALAERVALALGRAGRR